MRFARFVLIATLAFALTGCFKVEQTLRIENENDAVFEVRAAVPASTMAAAQQVPGLGDKAFCADKAAAEKLGLQVTVEMSTEGPEQVCLMKARGSLAKIAQVAADKSYLPKDAPPGSDALTYLLAPAGGGLWRLTVTLVPPPQLAALAGADEMTKAAQAMIFGSTDGKRISWAVEASEITESTGTVSPDKGRAEFVIPLGDLLSKPQAEYKFVTTFRP